MKETRTMLSRRNFLLAATAGTAAAAAAVVAKKDTEKASAADAGKPTGKGYQASEHVQNYYRTARI
jgi:hypothetical protein